MKQTAGKGRAKALIKTYLFSLEDDNKCMVSVSYYSLLGKTPVKLMLMLWRVVLWESGAKLEMK